MIFAITVGPLSGFVFAIAAGRMAGGASAVYGAGMRLTLTLGFLMVSTA